MRGLEPGQIQRGVFGPKMSENQSELWKQVEADSVFFFCITTHPCRSSLTPEVAIPHLAFDDGKLNTIVVKRTPRCKIL